MTKFLLGLLFAVFCFLMRGLIIVGAIYGGAVLIKHITLVA